MVVAGAIADTSLRHSNLVSGKAELELDGRHEFMSCPTSVGKGLLFSGAPCFHANLGAAAPGSRQVKISASCCAI